MTLIELRDHRRAVRAAQTPDPYDEVMLDRAALLAAFPALLASLAALRDAL